MEKLQMASHAIGDIEALLEASGIGEEDESGAQSFDEKLRELVIAALAGKDVEAATRQAELSIAGAKKALEQEEKNINAMLGGMDEIGYVGPRAPTLPEPARSMELRDFTLAALKTFGSHVTPQSEGVFLVEANGRREHIRFEEDVEADRKSTLFAQGTAAFLRLVAQVIATGIHDVDDLDQSPRDKAEHLARNWVLSFGATLNTAEIMDVRRCFDGKALIRVRATVAHDGYERLLEIPCSSIEHNAHVGSGLSPIPRNIEDPSSLGIDTDRLADAAKQDGAISEFCRFYLERRAQEVQAAGRDERKKKKLEDEFTPRLEMELVALKGSVHRIIRVKTRYNFETESIYDNTLIVVPHKSELHEPPELRLCARSNKTVPKICLEQCQHTKTMVLRHLLIRSETSARFALPEFMVTCSLTGKRILKDEAELSEVTGRPVASTFLKTSPISGKRAEPIHFGRCEFTNLEVLNIELAVSEISGKRYRLDELMRSVVSGKTGHKQEFLLCHETRQPVSVTEVEQCELTGNHVRPGVLQKCAVTQKKVLPGELGRCSATGKMALKQLLVTSSLTEALILEEVAIRSATGQYCAPVEARQCSWSSRKCHPDDLRVCELTGLSIHLEFTTGKNNPRLQALSYMLNGIKRTADEPGLWEMITTDISKTLRTGRCRIEAAAYSPDRRHLAVSSEVRTLLGLRVRQVGFVYSIDDHSIVGRLAQGRRTREGWAEIKS
jgi:hypothetical protein